jgi:RNA polymerase sigma-70 factor (ECF subfamily)
MKSPLAPEPLAAPAVDGVRQTLEEEEEEESREWLRALSVDSSDESLDRLRTHLLRATKFEVARRRADLPNLDHGQLDDLARAAADAATFSVVAHLDRYGGESRFTTWAAKFALLEAAVRLRELAWRETAPTRLRRSSRCRSRVGVGQLRAQRPHA